MLNNKYKDYRKRKQLKQREQRFPFKGEMTKTMNLKNYHWRKEKNK